MKLRRVKLGDICTFKYGQMPRKEDLVENGYPVFSGYRVVGYSSRFHYKQPEIVIVARGVGGTGDVKMSPARCFLTNLSIAALLKDDAVDKMFLYYLLTSTGLWELRTGTAQSQITIERLQVYEIELPPIAVQHRVASIVHHYDRLIENNRRRITILDEIAKVIYQEWFIHFRFPGHERVKMQDSDLGMVPEGWCQAYPVHVDFLEGPGLRRWQYRDSGLRFLNIRTIGDGDIDLAKTQFIDPTEAEIKYRHFLLAEYDHVVFSSGTIGRIVTVRQDHLPLMLNTSVIRMRPRGERVGRWQLKQFLKSDYFQTQIRSFASGVAQMNFGPSHLKLMKIIAPPLALGSEYEAIVGPIEELILNLTLKNSKLRTIRDLLLPKLVSGEINIELFEPEAIVPTV